MLTRINSRRRRHWMDESPFNQTFPDRRRWVPESDLHGKNLAQFLSDAWARARQAVRGLRSVQETPAPVPNLRFWVLFSLGMVLANGVVTYVAIRLALRSL